ncbi:hypothetical protein HG535_0D05990 [Zygotorulaspora mrakii]|uniref:rRNA-processing protein FYV7 n=1 Tax=Zygotorulaspora mrakii TaxID=42260 RepID=A0A7H9B2N8_ZYGMR|nr:uncharacterized protein HG535_0D05990 [Zygotorulaspora mrakii]QLG72890.1 hypothetical protein HG535_0D05990 [Zygotorulaspora mrakii]
MATTKQQENRKRFTKEGKVKEIRRSLTKKARLKKGYLKALKEEGYSIPEKQPKLITGEKARQNDSHEGKMKWDGKVQIKKQRKKLQRDLLEERGKKEAQKVKENKERLETREKRKVNMTKRTRSGQPLMGPKIEDLLSKIKDDETYTR